jgi:thiol-disulfide isomerase/thioredoxin
MQRFFSFFAILFFMVLSSQAYTAPVFKTLNGESIRFSSLQGKWVFINYWASWCAPCVEEIPELNRFQSLYKDKVRLFAVNYDDLPVPEQKKLLKKMNIQYTSLSQDPATELQLGDIPAVPVTFVIDPKGRHVKTLFGPQSLKTLQRFIV